MRRGLTGVKPDGLAVFGDGLVQLALSPQGDAEVAVGFGELGVEFDGLPIADRGAVQVPLVPQGETEFDGLLVAGGGAVQVPLGVQPRFLKFLVGLRSPAEKIEHQAAAKMKKPIGRLALDEPVEVKRRRVPFARALGLIGPHPMPRRQAVLRCRKSLGLPGVRVFRRSPHPHHTNRVLKAPSHDARPSGVNTGSRYPPGMLRAKTSSPVRASYTRTDPCGPNQ